ncbi:inosine-uridine preferring nucleoside hydrolase-like [Oppia nitens]|uniref:inosine-uridine preferring nucleoside hydrolase-like n=1 Tax=Oppia nitens TaxID=1686743 RepID=UPI0023DA694D|nr:inosine-uridine preferring nucleoside hydrolase-like [Oppia nitens]
MASQENYVIIDTDCGVDDAVALMLALDCHRKGLIRILAITCVYGNTDVCQVVRNVFLTLRLFGLEKTIRVLKGCAFPLREKIGFEDGFMGIDGLGNSVHRMPEIDCQTEEEHAAQAIVSLVQQFPKQIQLLSLGPLTNLALAQHLYPSVLNEFREIIAMGGMIEMLGNVGPTTEFNFFNDPEAVHMVLTNSTCPMTIVPWDTCLKTRMLWKHFDEIVEKNTEKSKFLENIYQSIYEHKVYGRNVSPGVVLCDIIVVFVAVFSKIIKLTDEYPVAIELAGHLTRGQLIIDRTGRADRKKFKNDRMARFVTELDIEEAVKVLKKALD